LAGAGLPAPAILFGFAVETGETMFWRLGSGVHGIVVQDDVVFLDVAADSYATLPGGAPDLQGLTTGRLTIHDPALAEDLVGSGLICRGKAITPPRALPSLPTKSLEPSTAEPPNWADATEAVRAGLDILFNYRRRPLETLLGRARDGADALKAVTPGLVTAVRAFHRWAPYAPIPAKCLARSFALLGFLQRAGFTADWVFAVRTWPFAAHCWLQIGDTVLDDHHEHLVAYQPIMVA
jgi:hypothetical protein